MHHALLVALLLACSYLGRSLSDMNSKWEIWKMKITFRRLVWEKNWSFVRKHNQDATAGKHSFTLTADKINDKLNGFNGSLIPQSLDWRNNGLVSPVMVSPICSCWAFSPLGALEGQMKKRTWVLKSLSPQNLLDCSIDSENGEMLPSFHYYRQGVYNVPSCKPRLINHAVLVVSYGSDMGKNSWGTTWGEEGYIRIARNKDNMCGIASFAVFPTL
uniref:Peptidase C1A papain C-terminal domain-containing protein n=1 Tax=Gouania willdenowi TaxID=441366 RepID=A0A8C5EIU2_GOUWI